VSCAAALNIVSDGPLAVTLTGCDRGAAKTACPTARTLTFRPTAPAAPA